MIRLKAGSEAHIRIFDPLVFAGQRSMKLSTEQFSQTLAALGCSDFNQPHEQRAAARVPMGTRATIIPCSETGRREPATVVVLNLSETGVGIIHAGPMRGGDNFILRLPAAPNQPAGAMLCAAVHCQTLAPGMYMLGARFVRVLSLQGDAPPEAPAAHLPAELAAEDLDHVRQVESRLSRLSVQ